MFIFPILIVLLVIMYIFYKVKILSLKDTLLMHFTNAKARLCLGLFIAIFGISQIVYYQTTVVIIVGLLFLFVGILQISYAIKLYRHYRNEILNQEIAMD